MKSRRVRNVSIVIILVVILNLIAFGTLIDNNKKNVDHKTTNAKSDVFEILSLNNIVNKYEIKLSEVENADTYEVIVTDETENEIAKNTSDKTTLEIEIPLECLVNNKVFIINAKSYSKEKELKSIKEIKKVTWIEPSISADNLTSIQDGSYTLNIDGVIGDNYRLIIKGNNQELYNEELKDNSVSIPTNLYKGKNITLNFEIVKEDIVISRSSVTNTVKNSITKPVNPISDVKITSPSNYLSLNDIVDVVIEYTGGDNATSKSIYIYENNSLIKSEVLTGNNYVIPSSMIKRDTGYRIVIEAVSGNFKKSDSVFISTITNGRSKMVELARTQIGNTGEKYWEWWGYSSFAEWCAMFVSWVANQNGYIDAGIIPKFQGVGSGVKWFKNNNQFMSRDSGYVPQPGDIIFFDYHPENALIDHVGIVDYSDGVNVYTIEGNVGIKPDRRCRNKTYSINEVKIYGYGVPNY